MREKIIQYFFIIAAVISILDAAFPQHSDMQPLKLALLTVAGLVVGVLVEEKHQQSFLIGAIGVLFGSFVFVGFLENSIALSGLIQMILNFNVFLAMVVIVVGIERVSSLITGEHEKEATFKDKIRDLKKLNKKELQQLNFERVWGTVILVAVAVTFIILLAEMFFDTNGYLPIIITLDMAITALFIVDLIILYRKSKNFGDFLRRNIFDIIAAIPFVGILRALKIVRVVRLVKAAKGAKAVRLLNMHKTAKFFSEESAFNKVQQKKPKTTKTSKKRKTKKSK